MINVHEAKTNFSKLLEQAHAGQEVILSKAGKPYARLMPLESTAPTRKPGGLQEIDTSRFFDALPEAELAAWEGETMPTRFQPKEAVWPFLQVIAP